MYKINKTAFALEKRKCKCNLNLVFIGTRILIYKHCP